MEQDILQQALDGEFKVCERFAKYIVQPAPEVTLSDLLARGMTLREAADLYRVSRRTGRRLSFLPALKVVDSPKDTSENAAREA